MTKLSSEIGNMRGRHPPTYRKIRIPILARWAEMARALETVVVAAGALEDHSREDGCEAEHSKCPYRQRLVVALNAYDKGS